MSTCKECENQYICQWKDEELKDCNLYIETQEAKRDNGKDELFLVPPEIIRRIAKVRMWATKNKYKDPNNWRKVSVDRYINALLRHTLLFWEEPYGKDEETGLRHLDHIATNVAFLCELMKEEENA